MFSKKFKIFLASFFCFLISISSLSVFTQPVQAKSVIGNIWNQMQDVVAQTREGYIELEQETVDALTREDEVNAEKSINTYWTQMQLQMQWAVAGAPQTGDPAADAALMKKFGRGAIPSVGTGIAMLYNRPASSTTYVADVLHSAHIIPQAQAQGLGFGALDPVLETWKTFRNVAYLFFVFTFLIIGFMIMFRHKIGGQTVVTAQQAIPQIIVSLLFVTFSYAIAGFMIDIMYLLMYFIIGLFDSDPIHLNKNILELGLTLVAVGKDAAFETMNGFIQELGMGVLGDIISWFGNLTAQVIVSIAVLVSLLKLFKELLISYVYVVCQVAFAPLFLMLGAIPGKNVFGNWVKQIVGNLAPFPTVLLITLMSEKINSYDLELGGFMPPFMLGPGMGGIMPQVIGIGMLMVLPEIITKVKEALGAKKGMFEDLAKVAGERFSRGAKPAKSFYSHAAQAGAGAAIGGKWKGKKGALAGAALGGIGMGNIIKGISRGTNKVSELGEKAENFAALGIDISPLENKALDALEGGGGLMKLIPKPIRDWGVPRIVDQVQGMQRARAAKYPKLNITRRPGAGGGALAAGAEENDDEVNEYGEWGGPASAEAAAARQDNQRQNAANQRQNANRRTTPPNTAQEAVDDKAPAPGEVPGL